MASRPLDVQKYTIGWLCALPIELAAARLLLDKNHEKPPYDPNDDTQYTLGSIGDHNVVIGCLSAGELGIGSAAIVATRMHAKFPNLRFGFMVGVGGGVPGKKDVRLGDIVVSQPTNGHGGVVQYRFGKWEQDGFVPTGFLNAPPQSLRQALANLQAYHIEKNNSVSPYLATFESRANFRRPESKDVLFMPTSNHIKDEETCSKCNKSQRTDRGSREHNNPVIHYGTIASGDCVMKNGEERDLVSSKFGGVLCFEMEAAGLMNNWPCLVIRGICDYADSHKNKGWQPYAAGAAAAYAKEVLSVISAAEVAKTQPLNEVIIISVR